MRLFFPTIFALLLSLSCFCQTRKIYLDKADQFIDDPKSAAFYVLIQKLSDSVFAAEKFSLKDDIIIKGFYKDSLLTIPNGKFLFYYKKPVNSPIKQLMFPEFVNFPSTVGYFINGKKTGMWVEFGNPGVKIRSYIYKNDKLNGKYKVYVKNDYIIEDGDFIDDKKEGDWNVYGYDTIRTVVKHRIYKKDELISEKDLVHPANFPWKLESYFLRKFKSIDTVNLRDVKATITIKADGKIEDVVLTSIHPPEISNIILTTLTNMPRFTPETVDSKPVTSRYSFEFSGRDFHHEFGYVFTFKLKKECGGGLIFNRTYVTR